MSSICTSRTWRTAVAPLCSSSKTVGSVRTGMPRSRQQRTTFARRMPGAEGIAIVTSSGSTSSRIRPSSFVVPSTRTPSIAQAPLERVVVDEADRLEAQLGVAQDLAQDEAPAVAGADDQQAARVLARRGSRAAGARRPCAR